MHITIREIDLELLPEKAVFLPQKNILIVSDLHLGKSMHFRKAGMAIPVSAVLPDLERLSMLLLKYTPQHIIFLGDLFHSAENAEWGLFCELMQQWQGVRKILTRGNHDVLSAKAYSAAEMEIVPEFYVDSLRFCHEPEPEISPFYTIYGHIHPGISLRGKGRQSVKIPCFRFGEDSGILPSFGSLTGIYRIQVSKKDRIFGIVNQEVLDFSHSILPPR